MKFLTSAPFFYYFQQCWLSACLLRQIMAAKSKSSAGKLTAIWSGFQPTQKQTARHSKTISARLKNKSNRKFNEGPIFGTMTARGQPAAAPYSALRPAKNQTSLR